MKVLSTLLMVCFSSSAIVVFAGSDCTSFWIDNPASGGGLDPADLDLTTEHLTETDLLRFSPYELRFIRNAVFAQYGRPFKDQDLRRYFLQFPWYTEDPSYSDSVLSPIARMNVEMILAAEMQPRGPWYLARFGVTPLPSGAVLCSRDDDGEVWFVSGVSPSSLLVELGQGMSGSGWQMVDGNEAWMRNDCGRDYPIESSSSILSRWVGFSIFRTENGTRIRAEYSEVPNPSGEEGLCGAFQTVIRNDLSREQKEEKLRVMQESLGHEAFVTVLRYFPIYDPERRQLLTFDRYAREMATDLGFDGDAPVDRDPVGAAFSMITNPSLENVARQMGLSWR